MSVPTLEQRLEALLAAVAEAHRPCLDPQGYSQTTLAARSRIGRYCETPLYFVRHPNRELVAYTAQGENHYFNCPYTQRLRKNREPAEQQTLLDTRPMPD